MADPILVVDDEPGIRALWRYELSSKGYDVSEAENGRAALEAMERASYDVVISDVRMPGLSGIDVLKAVRARAPGTEVIITTGYANLETAVECVRAGAFDLLQKPCQVKDLIASVERALERRRSQVNKLVATERLVAMGQLAAGVAHEMNNPLAYLQANQAHVVERLKELQAIQERLERSPQGQAILREWQEVGGGETLSELQAAMKDAADGAARVREIARDMRSLSRTDEQGAGEAVDLREVLDSALRVSGPQLKSVRVINDIRTGVRVVGKASRLGQVFLNLIVNAAQAMRGQQSRPRELHVYAEEESGQVLARLRDSGPGIKPEDARRLFQPFFTTKPPGEGTGLGLWLSREIVRLFNGELSVESAAGNGATFTVRLQAAHR
jgi:two-component system NtrC family sensor kinase